MKRNLTILLIYLLAPLLAYAQLKTTDSQYLVDQGNIVLNPGFENGKAKWVVGGGGPAFTLDSSTPLNGKSSAVWDATGNGQYVESSAVTIPEGLKGKACEVRISYEGGDSNLKIQALDGTSALIGASETVLNSFTGKKVSSAFFICPTSGSLKVRLAATGNAASIEWDNTYQGSLLGLVQSQTGDVFGAKVSSTDVVSGENVDWISGNCTNATTGQATCTFSAGIFTVEPNCTATPNSNAVNNREIRFMSISNTAFTVETVTNGTAVDGDFNVVCQKAGVDAAQSVQVYKNIPKIAENINEYTAQLDGTGNVLSENVDWINGNCGMSSGSSTCSFHGGIFTSAPNCTSTAIGAAAIISTVQSISSAQVQTRNFDVAGSANNSGRNITCQKNVNDFKTPVVQPLAIGQVITNSSSPIRIEGAEISCGSSGSGITSQSGSWISSVSNGGGTGACTVNIAAGIFSSTPYCTVTLAMSSTNAVNTGAYIAGTYNSTTIPITRYFNASTTNGQVMINCIGPR